MKIFWYFVVFLDFLFNIIKLDKPKFTISHTKSILIFSLLEAACAANASLYNKSANARIVLRYCASNVFHCTYTVVVTVFWFRESLFFFSSFSNRFVFFFSFKYWCKLTFILLYWHNKFHNIFKIIDVSISYKSR